MHITFKLECKANSKLFTQEALINGNGKALTRNTVMNIEMSGNTNHCQMRKCFIPCSVIWFVTSGSHTAVRVLDFLYSISSKAVNRTTLVTSHVGLDQYF